MSEATEARAFEAVSRHPRFADFVSVTRAVALRAARDRALVWRALPDITTEAERGTLTEAEAGTEFGNAWSALERGPKTRDERGLVRALWAHALAEAKTNGADEENELAARVLWLAAFTPFDATPLLDRALGDSADTFWPVLGERLRRLDAGELDAVSRAEAVLAALALRGSTSSAAQKEATRLAPLVTDQAVRGLLGTEGDAPSEVLGELDVAPRHPVVTTLYALSGILFVVGAARLVGRVALAYRRPAEVRVTAASIHVRSRTSILGRTLRQRDVVVGRQGLLRAVREVRYARAAFYAGLFALALGSLIGVRTFVDGVRAASPSLLFDGLLIVTVGIALDFLLGTLAPPGGEGKCRLVFVSRGGPTICVRTNAPDADRALAQLAR